MIDCKKEDLGHHRVYVQQEQDTPQSPVAHAAAIDDMRTYVKAKLTEEQANELRPDASPKRLADTLKLTKKGPPPGPDGLPYEFWRKFHDRYISRTYDGLPVFDPVSLMSAVFDDIDVHGHSREAALNEGTMCPTFKMGD